MLERMFNKLFSGRYFAMVAIITTYCAIMFMSLFLVVWDKIKPDVFLALMAAFSGQAAVILKSYFERDDRGVASINKTTIETTSQPITKKGDEKDEKENSTTIDAHINVPGTNDPGKSGGN